MFENIKGSERTKFLILNLALIFLCVLGLVLMVVAYPRWLALNPTSTPTRTKTPRPVALATSTPTPSLSPTLTRTSYPSLTPTFTLTPTWPPAPTEAPTQTGLPTLTPARAYIVRDLYDLRAWTPDQADYLSLLLESYPETLTGQARGANNEAYYQAFSFVVFSLKEALLRFPDAPQAERWRWRLAYNLARLGDPQAGKVYADLITEALNRGDVGLDNLYIWFQYNEPRIKLYLVELTPPSGYLASYLLELRSKGSAFLWILQSTRAYRTAMLLSHFDFVHQPQTSWLIANLDGSQENGDELVIYFSPSPGQFQIDAPMVFNLSQIPPRELPFLPAKGIFNLGLEFSNYWAVRPGSADKNNLLFKTTVFPACPVTISLAYQWNGLYFRFLGDKYEVEVSPNSLPSCALLVDHLAEVMGPRAAIPVMEALLPTWPPEMDTNGQPYPADARDEWRYRLGVYHALLGNQEKAVSYFREIVNSPASPRSRWISPASSFLDSYKQPEDIYRACLKAQLCDAGEAIRYLINRLPQGEDAFEYLRASGVIPASSGYFDFDGDGQSERWFTIRYRPLEKLAFWILMQTREGVTPIKFAQVSSTRPGLTYLDEAYVSPEQVNLKPVAFLDNKLAFNVQRLPDTQEPYLILISFRKEYPSRFFEPLKSAEKDLLEGASPKLIQQVLLGLQKDPGLLCKPTWSCDSYYYLLGLASELSGDERGAVEAYHRLWLEYSKSYYTIMARMKLSGGPLPSATPTITWTATETPVLSPTTTLTFTPTVTGTLPTATQTPTPFTGTPPTATRTPTPVTSTPTSTPTPTNTVSPYPGPGTGTPTLTFTPVPTPTPYP